MCVCRHTDMSENHIMNVSKSSSHLVQWFMGPDFIAICRFCAIQGFVEVERSYSCRVRL